MKLGIELIKTLELIKHYKVISREDIARILKINMTCAASRVGILRKKGYNIESFPTIYPKRVYKFPETPKDFNYASHHRILNGKTHIKIGMKNLIELVKKNPKIYTELFIEQQRELLNAITLETH